jgi:hypothetical protein
MLMAQTIEVYFMSSGIRLSTHRMHCHEARVTAFRNSYFEKPLCIPMNGKYVGQNVAGRVRATSPQEVDRL